MPLHRQGSIPNQRNGHHQGNRGEDSRCQEPHERRHQDMLHPLRQRNVLPRQRHPPVDRPDPQRQPNNHHRAQHDTLHHVPGRSSGPGTICFRERQERRHPGTEGPGLHHPDTGRSCGRAFQASGTQRPGDPCDRHPSWREDVRDAADQGRGCKGNRHGQFLCSAS